MSRLGQELSMNVSLFTLLGLIFAFVYLMSRMANQEKERKDRARLVEQALKNDRLSPSELADIVRTLRPTGSLFSYENIVQGRTVFIFGWLAIFVAMGLVVQGDNSLVGAGFFLGATGFGLVTLPMALREYEARRET